MKRVHLWAILIVLALLTPLGLWLPARFDAGDAWGEWGPEDLGVEVGFIPRQLGRLAGLWRAPAPYYAPHGWGEKPLAVQSAAYIASALLGIAVCAGAIFVLGRWLSAREERRAS